MPKIKVTLPPDALAMEHSISLGLDIAVTFQDGNEIVVGDRRDLFTLLGFYATLDADIREDYCRPLREALS